jgi:O-methyltransferase involved in polyketide biosynthesis
MRLGYIPNACRARIGGAPHDATCGALIHSHAATPTSPESERDASMGAKRIALAREKETLLVPLYSKAVESQRPTPIIVDPKAIEILEGVDYDFRQLSIPRQSLVTLAMRAKKLDSIVKDFIGETRNPLVLHLGCGLDSRVLRVQEDTVEWYDLDYPDVIELRKAFYSETRHYHMIASSVTDHRWLDAINGEGPACVIAEGLLMYLREEEVRSLLADIRERLPGSQIAFDAYSRLAAKGAGNHPSIRKTGAHIRWGIDDATQIESWATGVKLLEEWYFTDSEDIDSLGLWYRFMFGVAKKLKVTKKAHRVLHFQL